MGLQIHKNGYTMQPSVRAFCSSTSYVFANQVGAGVGVVGAGVGMVGAGVGMVGAGVGMASLSLSPRNSTVTVSTKA